MSNKTFDSRPFKKLKKDIETKQALSPLFRQKKEEKITDEDLFCSAMNGVMEIEEFRGLPFAQTQKKLVPCREKNDPDVFALMMLYEIAEGRRSINLPDTQEYVEWTNSDHHGKLTQRLHEGEFSVQACLDLHGYTVSEAETKLEVFLKNSLTQSLRCVKIIHGRGLRSVKGPQLKGAVIKRLSGHFRKDVIAFVTARQCDGGLGALYVLLKKGNSSVYRH